MKSSCVLLLVLAAACSDARQGDLAVFHTSRAVLAVRVPDVGSSPLAEKVRAFFPAACVDRDDDDDGIPNALDEHHRSSGGGDAGVDDDGDREDLDEDERDLACQTCNRGPGVSGEFRFERDGSHGKIDRARIVAMSGDRVTVASPDGGIEVRIVAGTEIGDGGIAPGAEIRAEGPVATEAGKTVLTADRIEVLCPAPAAMPDDAVPPGATPIPPLD